MGQLFYACAYDTEARECCVEFADVFASDCYSASYAVRSMHYLLWQKPYRIMWGGGYIVGLDYLKYFDRNEDLLGISIFENRKSFEECDHAILKEKNFADKVDIIDANHCSWNKIDVSDKAAKYFNWESRHSVIYKGYLLNHTQKQAIDLSDYFKKSLSRTHEGPFTVIDPLPVLTETGGGTEMAMFDGFSSATTEELATTWCGDLLQIVDTLPKSYELINCCFAEVWNKCAHCYELYGSDTEGYVLSNTSGERLVVVPQIGPLRRGDDLRVKAERIGDKVQYSCIP